MLHGVVHVAEHEGTVRQDDAVREVVATEAAFHLRAGRDGALAMLGGIVLEVARTVLDGAHDFVAAFDDFSDARVWVGLRVEEVNERTAIRLLCLCDDFDVPIVRLRRRDVGIPFSSAT